MIELSEVERWSLQENQLEKFNIFIDRFKKIKERD